MQKYRIPGGKHRKYTEDIVSSVSELCGEKYREKRQQEAVELSSDEETFLPNRPSLPWNRPKPQHKRTHSEFVLKPKAHSARPSLGPIDEEDEMSESEIVIRRIIEARQVRPPEPCRLQISDVLRDLSGERKQEEERKRKLKQHLLELLETPDMSFDSSSDQQTGRQTFPDTRSSLVSSNTVQGPGSSFLINATYERDKPIPQFHECAKPGRTPGRSRSISTHVREDEFAHSRVRLRSAAQALLPSHHRATVLKLLETDSVSHFIVALKDDEFAGLYIDQGPVLVLRYAACPMPANISGRSLSHFYRFDLRTEEFEPCDSAERDAFIYEYV